MGKGTCNLMLLGCCRSLDDVSEEVIKLFEDSAKTLIEEKGAVTALATALAVISGSTHIKARSLLSSAEVRHV